MNIFQTEDPAAEFKKTKEQLAEEKKVALQIRVKPLECEGMSLDGMIRMAGEMWDQLVALETEKYDLEERMKRQDYDVSGPQPWTQNIILHLQTMKALMYKHYFLVLSEEIITIY